MRLKEEDILKPGEKLQAFKVGEYEESTKELFCRTIQEQKRVLELKNVDYSKLRDVVITI